MIPGRVVINETDVQSAGSSQLAVSIRTDGAGPALVTLDTNIGFPAVRDLYAQGGDGRITLTVRFAGAVPNTASKLAVVCLQSGATKYEFP
jgi:hypothetical protein